MIRRVLAMLALAGLGAVAADPPVAAAQTGPWSVRVSAGGFRMSGGDLGAAINGMSLYNQESRGAVGAFARVGWGLSWGGEAACVIGPRSDVFLSVGVLRASRRSEMASAWWAVEALEEIRPSVDATMLLVGVGHDLHRSPDVRLRLFAAAGLVTGTMRWESTQRFTAQAFFERNRGEWEGRAVAPAVQGGLTLEKRLTFRLALVGELSARHAVLSGLRGRYEVTVSDLSGSVTTEGSASAWSAQYSSGTRSYPWLVFQETKPTAAFYDDVREFRLALSGVSFGLGLRYRF